MLLEYDDDKVLGIFNHIESTVLNSFLKALAIPLIFLSKSFTPGYSVWAKYNITNLG